MLAAHLSQLGRSFLRPQLVQRATPIVRSVLNISNIRGYATAFNAEKCGFNSLGEYPLVGLEGFQLRAAQPLKVAPVTVLEDEKSDLVMELDSVLRKRRKKMKKHKLKKRRKRDKAIRRKLGK